MKDMSIHYGFLQKVRKNKKSIMLDFQRNRIFGHYHGFFHGFFWDP